VTWPRAGRSPRPDRGHTSGAQRESGRGNRILKSRGRSVLAPALDINVRQLIELKFWIILQFLAFARKIRLFGIRLRTDGHILASGHRHGASHQPCDAHNQDIVLRRRRGGDANDQARGRNNAVVGPEDPGRNQPIRATRWFSGCR